MATKRRKRRKSGGLRGTPTDHLIQAAEYEEAVIDQLRSNKCNDVIEAYGSATAMQTHAYEAGPDGAKFKRAAVQLARNAMKKARKVCGCGGSR